MSAAKKQAIQPPAPLEKLDPLSTLKAAAKAVPAVRFAIGITGVASAAAIIKGYFSSFQTAFVATLALIALMILLWAFSHLARLSPRPIQIPVLILAWVVLLLIGASGTLVVLSVFFDYPKPFSEIKNTLLSQSTAINRKVPPINSASSSLEGVVLGNSGESLEGVSVSTEPYLGPTRQTQSEGAFSFSIENGKTVTLHFRKVGYKSLDIDVTSPSNSSYRMERQE